MRSAGCAPIVRGFDPSARNAKPNGDATAERGRAVAMPERLTLDELIVATMVSQGPADPGQTVRNLRELRIHLSRAAAMHDPDLTLDDEVSLAQALAITHDANDLEGLRHE